MSARGPAGVAAHIRSRRAVRAFWSSATNLAELGELTARYLEGAVAESPTHVGPPDEETASIRDRLAALNRAGLITYGSQPGEVDEYGRQRAVVEAFCLSPTLLRVETACRAAGLGVIPHPPGSRPPLMWSGCPSVPVTEDHHGRVYTDVGGWMPPGDVATFHRRAGCRRTVVADLLACWQVEAYDPVWGRADVLWTTLADALGIGGAT